VKRTIIVMLGTALLLVGMACSSSSTAPKTTPGSDTKAAQPTGSSAQKVTVHLAYFPNLTHAPALVGVFRNTVTDALGPNVTLDTKTFNAGPDVVTALLNDDIDIAYIGPNPSINGYTKSNGEKVRIIAGATSGGALLIVQGDSNINSAADLKGKKIATPQLGNTQDVALRAYLKANGLSAPATGGGDVDVIPTANSDTINLFKQKQIDGAWVPEPFATRLVQESGGRVFLDEATLWTSTNGQFVTTNVVVRPQFLADHPDVVQNFLKGHVETVQWISQNPAEAKAIANQAIANINNAKPLAQAIVDGAWAHLTFTYDPIAASLRKGADDAYAVGALTSKPDLTGIYNLGPLNSVLRAQNLPEVSAQ
jgi:NitT/TauT family transport system substrate-binding protein